MPFAYLDTCPHISVVSGPGTAISWISEWIQRFLITSPEVFNNATKNAELFLNLIRGICRLGQYQAVLMKSSGNSYKMISKIGPINLLCEAKTNPSWEWALQVC